MDRKSNDFTIVYKTYANDLKWLKYSLLSVKKFVTGFEELIIYCHDVCCGELYALTRQLEIPCRIIPVSYDYNGYMKQMVVKSICYKDVKTKYIVMVDSDVIFNNNICVSELIEPDGKIKWYYLTSIPSGHEVLVWKDSYQAMTKTVQDRYYMMNGFPFVFTTESLKSANEKFIEMHGIDYSEFCKKGCARFNIRADESVRSRFLDLAKIFEEFEWIGFYCQHFSNDYIFIDSDLRTHNKPTVQFWSHGGITPEIQNKLDALTGSY
jgi:hypothetical protein